MTVLALAFAIGVLNGLRSFTPPAVASWAAPDGSLRLARLRLASVGRLDDTNAPQQSKYSLPRAA